MEGYCDPLSTWTENGKINKKASELAEASKLGYVEHGCGGKLSTWTYEVKDSKFVAGS